MAKSTWVQGNLFAAELSNPQRGIKTEPTRRRLSYTRVTRDPVAALSCAESRLVAAQVTNGLAAAFGRLSPERRAALRAAWARRSPVQRSA